MQGRTGLYAIIDEDALDGRDPVAFTERVLAAGALFAVQLRAKTWAARRMLAVAQVLAEKCARAGVPFFVNDRPDVALVANARGVHVGQDDLALPDARRVAAGLLAGVSTHNEAQAREALAMGPDYLAIGPVFQTGSKKNPDPVVGLEGLARVVKLAGSVPVVAIGGITLERAGRVREAGATAAAVISALTQARDDEVTARARALHSSLGGR